MNTGSDESVRASGPEEAASSEATSGEAAAHDHRISEFCREAWGQALVAVNTAEDEVQRFLGRVGGWFEMKPEEARKLGTDLSERLRQQRGELERTVETALHKALTPFRSGRREELTALADRLASLEQRIDRLIERRQSGR